LQEVEGGRCKREKSVTALYAAEKKGQREGE